MPAFHGAQLARELELRALTPTTVAKALGVRRDTVYRALRGDSVSARTAEALLTLLDRRPKRENAEQLLATTDDDRLVRAGAAVISKRAKGASPPE